MLTDYHKNVSDQGTCDTPTFMEINPVTATLPEGYRFIYIDEVLNN